MSEPSYGDWLNIRVGFDLSQAERQFLHSTVTEMFDELAPLKIQTGAGPLGRGPGPAEYLATISEIVGAVSGVATTVSLIAQAIIAWHRKVQQAGVKTPMTLEAPGKPSLDLNDATDEQIRIYIIHLRVIPSNNDDQD